MNQEINIQNALVNDDEWKQIIKKPLPERTPYEKNSHLTISRLAGRILGTPHDETDYYIYLHELYASGDVHVLSETLDKTISPGKVSGHTADPYGEPERKRTFRQSVCRFS